MKFNQNVELDRQLISKLTGASISALEAFENGDVSGAKKISDGEVFIEGVIVSAGDWLSMFTGFYGPEQLREDLADTKGDITLYIDSPGGSVYGAANMMSQLIKLRKKGRKVKSVVTGLCASAATYFLLESDSTEINRTGSVMMHRVSACGCGDYKGFRKIADVLEKYDAQYVEQIADKTGKDADEILKMVDEETWLTAQEAIDLNLIDALYELDDDDDTKKQVKNSKKTFHALLNQLAEIA